ncbi:hypothetical protein BFP72_11740 [Reichenbachiella sp. 5M10]|uniref:hypothetical protein n=1 Tax=Reichenbachiella sp. 5M10 TaxID=1889772 RepID=UPI000C14A5FB|nr:hypothetical protein [Reichenbachiella sp. 5M10]PIB36018.1 hypothetical protein BFP72_11740 [Reichenbachiella sp. 5M10]
MLQNFLLATLVFALSFTSTFAEVEDKKKPKDQDPKIERLLIVVLVRNVEQRKILEDELSYDFSDYGIKTILSYTTRLAGAEHVTKEEVKRVCKKTNADGVMIVKLVDIEQQNGYSYNQRAQYQGAGAPSATSSGVVFTNRGTYSWGDYAYGNYFDAVSSNIVEIQTDIYHVDSEKRVFQNDNKFRVGEIESAIGKFSKTTTKRVVKTKQIKRNED